MVAVDAVLAVKYAPIGEKNFQQRDTPAVRGKGVTAASHRGRSISNKALTEAALCPAGGAGGVIFGGIGQDRQLFQDLHTFAGSPNHGGFALAAGRPLNGIQHAEDLCGYNHNSHNYEK